MIAPHLRGGGFHVPLEVVQPVLTACGIEVTDSVLLRARCPAEDRHTTDNKPGDCVIFPNNAVPQICCHHTSCKEQLEAVNRQLRGQSRHAGCLKVPNSRDGCQQNQSRALQRQGLQRHAARILPLVLEKYRWPVSAMVADSPTPITLPVWHHHRHIFDLFDDKDVVWTGERVNQTGLPWHDLRFRTVKLLSERMRCPGVFICPSTFAPGSYSRSGENVVARKFLVVESDKLKRSEVGAVFRMVREELGMHLRAVVYTGRRSLHAWFDMPTPSVLTGLEVILPAMGCDPAMFRPTQPCRLPGAVRPETQRYQELLYLDLNPPSSCGTLPSGTAAP